MRYTSYMLQALALLIIGSLTSAALITPWVYEFLKSYFESGVPWPYSRVFDRVAMLCVVAFLLLLRKHFSLREAFVAFRAEKRVQAIKRIGAGIALALGSVACTVPFLVYWTGDIIWEPRALDVIARKSVKIFFAGLLIGVIEESFFRVILLNKFRQHLPVVFAVLGCSVIYAAVHFITPVKSWEYEQFSWDVGFTYMAQVAGQFLHPTVPSSFLGLLLVGIVLCWVMLRYRSLYLCIGLHAGWVMGVKGVKLIGEFNPALGIPPGRISQYFLVSLPLAWCSILCVFAVLFLCRPRRSDDVRETEQPGQRAHGTAL